MSGELLSVLVSSGLRALGAADRMLDATVAFSEAHELMTCALLERRLVPDMFPLYRQFEIISSGIAGATARLAGRIGPDYVGRELAVFNRGADHEFSAALPDIDTLRASVREARESLRSLRVQPHLPIRVCKPGEQRSFASAETFVFDYVLPNLYFHVSIAHAILRSAGVPLGKGDYMGQDVYEVEHAPAHDLPLRSEP